MARLHLIGAMLLLAASPVLAQTGTGGSGGISSIPRASSPSSGANSGSTSAPSDPATMTPRVVTNPNNQVAPSAATLPGGGGNVPDTVSSGIERNVPAFAPRNLSVPSVSGSINASETRSQSTDCSGTGTRSSTGSGSTSTTVSGCGLGTQSIMGGGGTINVSP